MFKKLLPVFVIVLALICTFVCANAQSPVCTNIQYLDADGNVITSYTEGSVFATAKLENNTDNAIKPVLVVSGYKDGVMNGIWYKSAEEEISVGGNGEVVVEFTPVEVGEGCQIKATLVDSLKTLKAYLKSAEMLNDTTDLEGIIVDGVYLEGYSNEVTSYAVQSENGNIVPVVSDGGTVAKYTAPENIPGYGKITVTSAFGNEKEIDVLVYNSPEQLYSLKTLKYYVNGEEYVMDWLESDVTEYEIELDPNTFYVTVEPELYMEGATATVKVQDIDHNNKTFGDVKYVNGSLSALYKTAFSPRKAFDNVIPIKNEATNAVIEVEYEGQKRTYTFTFTCVQPRLTSFNITEGAIGDAYKPSFMGGAALNNDNASATGTDRGWAFANLSQEFIGGSSFLIPAASNRPSGSQWYKNADGEEYFNFTADTAGTIYMVMATALNEAELSPNYANDGWECLQTVHSTGFGNATGFAGLPVTFNDYTKNVYQTNFVEFGSADDRFNKENSFTNPPAGKNPSVLAESYRRTFQAGEEVKIYHVGAKTNNGNPRSNVFYFIVWDLEN